MERVMRINLLTTIEHVFDQIERSIENPNCEWTNDDFVRVTRIAEQISKRIKEADDGK